ncbi:MAG: PilZ domain-containing protein [Pseudomonadota bacterium]
MATADNSARERIRSLQKLDRRRYQRVKVDLLGRFMLSNRREFPCQLLNMSPGGAALITPVQGEIGERIIAYIDHIGRVEGEITRLFDGGMAMTINATLRKRDKLAAQLTWLANRHELNLPEDRRHERALPKNPFSHIKLPDGREYRCKVIDISLSGAALALNVKPAIGAPVTLGVMKGRVVRHFEDGVAVEFAAVQSPQAIKNHISP